MKSILIIGTSDAGQSTTMREVCKRLNPDRVYRLRMDIQDYKKSSLKPAETDDIFNDTFVIEVAGHRILVVAGAPTEQEIRLTVLLDICAAIEVRLSFALVSMRSYERREGYDTPAELASRSEIVLTERICRVGDENFGTHTEWNARIDKIIKTLQSHLSTAAPWHLEEGIRPPSAPFLSHSPDFLMMAGAFS